MPYRQDPWLVSLLGGRLGSAILAFVAAGVGGLRYTLGPEDIEMLGTLITTILSGIGGILALVSKLRERRKVDETSKGY